MGQDMRRIALGFTNTAGQLFELIGKRPSYQWLWPPVTDTSPDRSAPETLRIGALPQPCRSGPAGG